MHDDKLPGNCRTSVGIHRIAKPHRITHPLSNDKPEA
jgi:hypothetical protein